MTAVLWGVVVGGGVAAGLLLMVLSSPPLRRRTLADRVAPYLSDAVLPSKLLASGHSRRVSAPVALLAPVLQELVRRLDSLVGGQASVRRRLEVLGGGTTVEEFRTEQVIWGAGAAAVGMGIGVPAVLFGGSNVVGIAVLVLACAIGGVLARDWALTRSADRRDSEILAEFPVIAEMLALAVTAGEGPLGAIERITRLASGHLVDQFSSLLADVRAGTPLLTALTALRDRTRLAPFARFLDGMAVAVERGTPLADVLRAQAADVRELGKRELLEAGGRKEIAMMLPVVFLVLPITILFAVYPGLVTITVVAG
ncbi:pilus assembly protein TadB [Nakamurella sp. YIM 132087]|uniref:Pilus assembly protein TadB n=1 Tax=Nakamurella alba TaxID=2665158 RepID=A0A7K1FGP6_9ACTN|nr:type II secretion system F family protein [Nakamurella alba]MTD13282.1 pilus assembly protein TadB [Nakamurella alba]